MNDVKRPMVRKDIYDAVMEKRIDDEPFSHVVERINTEHSTIRELHTSMATEKNRQVIEAEKSTSFYQLLLLISLCCNFALITYFFMSVGFL